MHARASAWIQPAVQGFRRDMELGEAVEAVRVAERARPRILKSCLDPFSLPHQGFGRTGGGDAVDVELTGADHPVNVDEAIVRAFGG